MKGMKGRKIYMSSRRLYSRDSFNAGGAISNGIGAGSALAMIISYTAYKSIGWAILHGIFGWAYVIYYAIRY